tara:strand:+ start:188624 stop:189064 length:441 start_codon:yes stop_codon:yes gene_type:complete
MEKIEAEQIFEKHIGLNAELGYLPYKKEDIIGAINEALTIQRTIQRVSQQRELLIAYEIKHNCRTKERAEQMVDYYLTKGVKKLTIPKEGEVDIPYDAQATDFYFGVLEILDNLGVEYKESGEETITIKYKIVEKGLTVDFKDTNQ